MPATAKGEARKEMLNLAHRTIIVRAQLSLHSDFSTSLNSLAQPCQELHCGNLKLQLLKQDPSTIYLLWDVFLLKKKLDL